MVGFILWLIFRVICYVFFLGAPNASVLSRVFSMFLGR